MGGWGDKRPHRRTAMKLDSLAPCPFCGGEARLAFPNSPRTGFIYCLADCGAEMRCRSQPEAIAAWNKRHVPEGFAIVPVEPTEWMIDAAHEAVDAYWNYNGDGRPGGPEGVYAAMLSAAKGDV